MLDTGCQEIKEKTTKEIYYWIYLVINRRRPYWSDCRSHHEKGSLMGWIANIIAGLVGSSVGQALLDLGDLA